MSKLLPELLSRKYKPVKAYRRLDEGSFTRYRFKGGTELRVRKLFEDKLLDPGQWRYVRVLSGINDTTLHKVGGVGVVVRRVLKPFYGSDPHYADLLTRAVGNRVVTESPLLELTTATPWGEKFLVTRTLEGKNIFAALQNAKLESRRNSLITQSAEIMAKLHASGIEHGHPHHRNWIVKPNGTVVIVDPKLFRKFGDAPLPSRVEELVAQVKSGRYRRHLHGENNPIRLDLRYFIRSPHLKHEERLLFLKEYQRVYREEYEKKAR